MLTKKYFDDSWNVSPLVSEKRRKDKLKYAITDANVEGCRALLKSGFVVDDGAWAAIIKTNGHGSSLPITLLMDAAAIFKLMVDHSKNIPDKYVTQICKMA